VILSPGTSISFRYVGWVLRDNVISGILAVLQKKATLGSFANENLNPTGDRKFLLSIWLGKEQGIFIFI
jgi:hypothetical protein